MLIISHFCVPVLLQFSSMVLLLAGPHNVGASYSNYSRCPSVCLSLCHMWISPKLSEIDIWLLGNLNRKPRLPGSECAVRFAIGSTVSPFWAVTAEDWKWRILGKVEFTGTCVVLAVGKKPWHGETRLGGASETATVTAVRRHQTEHRGGPAIVTSHDGRYRVFLFVLNACFLAIVVLAFFAHLAFFLQYLCSFWAVIAQCLGNILSSQWSLYSFCETCIAIPRHACW